MTAHERNGRIIYTTPYLNIQGHITSRSQQTQQNSLSIDHKTLNFCSNSYDGHQHFTNQTVNI